MLVDLDPLLVIQLDADFFSAQTFAKRFASDRDEHFVGLEFQLFVSLVGGCSNTTIVDLDRADFGFEVKGNSLRGKRALEQVR